MSKEFVIISPENAKPAIPSEKPREREVPEIQNPVVIPIPTPTETPIPQAPPVPVEVPEVPKAPVPA